STDVCSCDLAFAVDANAVRTNKHSGAKTLHHLSGFIEFHNGRQARPGAVLSAPSFESPDAGPVAINGDAGRGTDLSPLWKLEPVLDGLIDIMLGIGSLGQRN